MATTVYSFADVALIVSHPQVGRYVAHGPGIGSLKVTMSTENSKHDVAADGSVMVSKVLGSNGTLDIDIQQTSDFDRWLLNAYNYAYQAAPGEWAEFAFTLRSPLMGDLINGSGVSFQIRPERPFEAEGQHVTWTMMAAQINPVNVAQTL